MAYEQHAPARCRLYLRLCSNVCNVSNAHADLTVSKAWVLPSERRDLLIVKTTADAEFISADYDITTMVTVAEGTTSVT